jgi:hypothetical protein
MIGNIVSYAGYFSEVRGEEACDSIAEANGQASAVHVR